MYLQKGPENLMALIGPGVSFIWSVCSAWRWCGTQCCWVWYRSKGSAQLTKGRSGGSLSISRSHRHKFAIVCPELEHRRWNTAKLLDLACATLARNLSTHSWGNSIWDGEQEALPWKGNCHPAGCCQLLAWVKQTPWIPSFTKHISVIEAGNTTVLRVTLPAGVRC